MPFIAPLIGAAIGGIAATAIGQAVIGTALSLAMGAAARRLAPKPDTQASSPRGVHLQLAADAQMPRVLVFGEAAVAGSLVYHHVSNQTKRLELVIALADHECDSMTGLWVNGREVTWNSGTGLVDEFSGMLVRFYSGAWSQTADADLIANSGGRWTSDHRGRGICYAYVRMNYNADLYKSGMPTFLFKIKGAKLYDWRKDTTAGGSGSHRWGDPTTYEWSDNPAVVWYNYRRGIFVNSVRVAGMTTAADALPLDAATAAANACDELVSLKAGGTEKRYRISAAVVTAQQHRDVLRDIIATTAGEEIDTGGEFKLAPGIAQTPVMALTDDDLMADAEVEWSGKQSRKDLLNAVLGSFRDPTQRYEAVSLPPRLSSADETTDGDRFEQRYDLDMVASGTQGQRVLEILRRRARRQGVVKAVFRAKACPLEPGDWITWTSARYGWDTKTFEVISPAPAQDLSTEVVLREIDADVYAWTPATDELDSSTIPDLAPGGGGLTSLTSVALQNILVTSGASSAERPGLKLTWTAVDDPSVVEIEIEVRRQGDTDAIGSRKAFDPSTGQFSWIDGVIGETIYEARARPVTLPPRPVSWSSWVTPGAATNPQIVDVGTVIPEPGSVGPNELDAQTLFELRLSTAIAEVQGSAASILQDAISRAEKAADEALRALLDARGAKALVRQEQITRETEDSALAALINQVITNVDGNTASVTEVLESLNGVQARWGVAINVNGQVVGLVQLDGDATESTFTVLSDKFIVAKPDGTGATPIFIVGDIDGSPAVGVNGNLIVDGTVLARHLAVTTLSAIVADIGEVTAGKLRSSDNKMVIDLDAKSITMSV